MDIKWILLGMTELSLFYKGQSWNVALDAGERIHFGAFRIGESSQLAGAKTLWGSGLLMRTRTGHYPSSSGRTKMQ
jgi:hypothetical protein